MYLLRIQNFSKNYNIAYNIYIYIEVFFIDDNFLGYKIQNAAPLSEAAGELKYILKSNDNFNEVNITYSNGNPVISTNHKDKGQCNIFFVNGLVDKSTELIWYVYRIIW